MKKYQFWLYVLCAAIILNLPLVSLPFKWLESYFHEISHGLAAILTGGKIVKIQLFISGAGLCTSQGGIRFIISFMGYAGAILWGALIFLMANWHQKSANIFSWLLVLLFSLSIILWVRDVLTLVIVGVLLALNFIQLKLIANAFRQKILKVLGLVVLLNAFFSPWYLLDGRNIGDGAALANLTYVPEIIWVILWAVLAFITLFYLSKKTIRH